MTNATPVYDKGTQQASKRKALPQEKTTQQVKGAYTRPKDKSQTPGPTERKDRHGSQAVLRPPDVALTHQETRKCNFVTCQSNKQNSKACET